MPLHNLIGGRGLLGKHFLCRMAACMHFWAADWPSVRQNCLALARLRIDLPEEVRQADCGIGSSDWGAPWSSPALASPSRSPGTSSTAMRGRWPGGSPTRARSRPSSASRAVGWCRRPSWRASSSCKLVETVCVASYHDYSHQGEIKVLKTIAPSIARHRQRQGQGRAADRRPHRHRQDGQGRARDAARCAFRHRLRQAGGRPDVPHVHNRGLAGHLDLFPLGPGPAIRGAHQRRRAPGEGQAELRRGGSAGLGAPSRP